MGGERDCLKNKTEAGLGVDVNYQGRRARDFGVRGAGASRIRCGKLARSRESDWLSLVKILIRAA